MIDFIQHNTMIFPLLAALTSLVLYYDRKRRERLHLPLSRTKKLLVFLWCAPMLAFAGFVLWVLASHS
jgi:hypothetical protein